MPAPGTQPLPSAPAPGSPRPRAQPPPGEVWASALEGNRGGPAPGRVREGTRTFSHSTSIYSAATKSWSARTSGSGLDWVTGSRPGRARTHSICAPPAFPSEREPPSPPTPLQPGLHHRPHHSESSGLLSSCFYSGGRGRESRKTLGIGLSPLGVNSLNPAALYVDFFPPCAGHSAQQGLSGWGWGSAAASASPPESTHG